MKNAECEIDITAVPPGLLVEEVIVWKHDFWHSRQNVRHANFSYT
jgi:hypothetical protein